MARTYRRKNNYHRWWLHYDNEAEFNVARDCSLKDYSELLSNKPKTPSKSRWLKSKFDWDTYKTNYVQNTDPVVVAEWAAWDAYHNSDEYFSFRVGVRFIRETRNAKTYKEYVRNNKNAMTRDSRSGASWCGNAPSWYCNQYFERPMRRAVKKQLKRACKYDTFDETVYVEWTNGAAWSYW